MNSIFKNTLEFAKIQDGKDPLRNFINRFFIAGKSTIYMDGNSLGRLPKNTKELIADVVERQWGSDLIESWNKNWYNKSVELGDKIAQIIGASKGEVIVADSTSINLYKLVKAALKLQKARKQIISDVFNFPTDLYILQGIIREFGNRNELILARSNDETTIDLDDLKSKITDNTAIVVLSMVAFKSAYLYDVKKITEWAHQKGALVLWDLSHAAGAVPVELNNTNADLAVGCTYKYLNGGPGSPAFLYVRKDLQPRLYSPIQGWFGDEKPFEFNLNFRQATNIQKFLVGTPAIISQLAIEPGLDLTIEAGIGNIHQKSILQSEYFISLVNKFLTGHGYEIGSPIDFRMRGSHLSLKHTEASRISQALIYPRKGGLKIIPDFREPNIIRFGITPLYTTFLEIWSSAMRLKEIVEAEEYKSFSSEIKGVT